MTLASLIRADLIFPDLPGSDRQTVLRAIADRIVGAGVTDSTDKLYGKLLEREDLGSTSVAPGVAIPHCKYEGLSEVMASVGICRDGVAFGAADGQPVRLFFTVISPENDPAAHLQSLALISRWLKAERNVERLLELGSREEILQFLLESSNGGQPTDAAE